MSALARIALALPLLVACGRSETKQSAPPPRPVQVVDRHVAPPLRKASFVHFDDGQLFECLDIEETPGDGGAIEKIADSPEVKSIDKPCGVAFRDRTALGRCTVRENGGSITSSFYDFETVGESDEQMSSCLEMGGGWWSLPRDTPEWHLAALGHASRNLRKATRSH